MSSDLYEIARSMGRLDLLSPELAELEARHRLEEQHAERMREMSEQRQNPALAAEIERLEQENADLKAKLAQANCDTEPHPRHRNSLLRVIAALLELADLGQEEKPFTRANFCVFRPNPATHSD